MVLFYRFRWENFDIDVEQIFVSEQELSPEEFRRLCIELYQEAAREALESEDYISGWTLSEAVVEKLKQRGFIPLKCDVEFYAHGSPDESSERLARTLGTVRDHISTILGENLASLIKKHNERLSHEG